MLKKPIRISLFIRTLLITGVAISSVLVSFGAASVGKKAMVFEVAGLPDLTVGLSDAHAADMLGALAASKMAPTPNSSGNCASENFNSGKVGTQPAAGTGSNRYCYGMYTCPPTCTNPVTGDTMPPGYTCRVGMYTTGEGNLAGRRLPLNVADCARQGVEWRFTQPAGGNRMPNIGAAIDPKTGCYTEYTWFSGNSQASGVGDARLTCPSTLPSGYYADNTTGGGNGGNTGGTTGGTTGGGSGSLNQLLSQPIGAITSANCQTVQGWAFDPSRPISPVTVRPYVQKSGAAEQFLGLNVTADISRTDIFTANMAGQLRVDATAFAKHGFSFELPSTVAAGDKLMIYAVKQAGSWNPLVAEITVTCSGTQSSGPSITALNAVVAVLATTPTSGGGTGLINRIEGTSPKTWAEWQAFCAANPAQLCMATPGDGVYSCAVAGKGVTQEEQDRCRARVETCKGRGGIITGFCDPGKITACREAGYATDWAQRVDTEQCSDYLWENGCSSNPANCRPECILPNYPNRPADCGGTTPPPPASGGEGCVDSRGMPIRCTTPPPPSEDGCVDSRGMPTRCTTPPPASTPPASGGGNFTAPTR